VGKEAPSAFFPKRSRRWSQAQTKKEEPAEAGRVVPPIEKKRLTFSNMERGGGSLKSHKKDRKTSSQEKNLSNNISSLSWAGKKIMLGEGPASKGEGEPVPRTKGSLRGRPPSVTRRAKSGWGKRVVGWEEVFFAKNLQTSRTASANQLKEKGVGGFNKRGKHRALLAGGGFWRDEKSGGSNTPSRKSLPRRKEPCEFKLPKTFCLGFVSGGRRQLSDGEGKVYRGATGHGGVPFYGGDGPF